MFGDDEAEGRAASAEFEESDAALAIAGAPGRRRKEPGAAGSRWSWPRWFCT